ncbi:MAG: right-handed parallel beta-helix repeat-containing protein, partial [Acidimicrobiia bacterium]
MVLVTALPAPGAVALSSGCQYWLAPGGSDSGTGSIDHPWKTLDHATRLMPDAGCTLTLRDGEYQGAQQIERRFSEPVLIRAEHPHKAILTADETVLHIDGARNVTVSGLEIHHHGPGSQGYVVIVDATKEAFSESIVISDNVIHDSFDNDLLKVHNGSRHVRVEGNVFYNQGPSEQHLDINSVDDVVIERNIFFNDYAGSGRPLQGDAKHFIVIKDSNGAVDGLLGSRNVTVRRNVFANWQGGKEAFIAVGNDGKPYYEAIGVDIENNLMVGNSPHEVGTILSVAGAREVRFVNNTVVGDLPSSVYALRVNVKGENPKNEQLTFVNNIWSDPTGTMGAGPGETDSLDFSGGDPDSVSGLVLDRNLYWNGGAPVPGGDVASPGDDPHAVFADPKLVDRTSPLPRWTGSGFADGSSSIPVAFARLVAAYGAPAQSSPAANAGDPVFAPDVDIMGRLRGPSPSLGAFDPGAKGSFADVGASVFEGDIEWLASVGVTRGCNPPANTLFCPGDVVTRG